jgi:hypothetical protein
MVVNEGLEVAKPDETLPQAAPAPAEAARVPSRTTLPVPRPSWLRLAYCFEFLIAMLTVFTLWSEIGGQGHLDLMPWYTKLACGLGMAWCTIRFTAGLVEEPRPWNSRSARWFSGLIAIAIVMGVITYYYHLHEAVDQPDSDDTTATSVKVAGPLAVFSRTSGTNR